MLTAEQKSMFNEYPDYQEYIILTTELQVACEDAIDIWGKEAQIQQTIGEIGEFLDVYGKMGQGRANVIDFAKEAADIMIMMCQIRAMVGTKFFDNILAQKVDKFKNKLYSDKDRI